jgi:magnesium transporter
MAAFFQEEIESLEEFPFQPIWVDLESPRWKKTLDQAVLRSVILKTRWTRTLSARFYEEDNGEPHPSELLVAMKTTRARCGWRFILNLVNDDLKSRGVLFSIHDEDVPVFPCCCGCGRAARG